MLAAVCLMCVVFNKNIYYNCTLVYISIKGAHLRHDKTTIPIPINTQKKCSTLLFPRQRTLLASSKSVLRESVLRSLLHRGRSFLQQISESASSLRWHVTSAPCAGLSLRRASWSDPPLTSPSVAGTGERTMSHLTPR